MSRRLPPAVPAWPPLYWCGPILPPPLNHLYIQVRGGSKIRNPAVVRWQAALQTCLAAAVPSGWVPAPPAVPLTVVVVVQAPNLFQWDLDGRLKVLFDALAGAVGHDDRYFVYTPLYKQRGPVRTVVRVQPHRPEDLTDGRLCDSVLTWAGHQPVWLPGDEFRLAGPTRDLHDSLYGRGRTRRV